VIGEKRGALSLGLSSTGGGSLFPLITVADWREDEGGGISALTVQNTINTNEWKGEKIISHLGGKVRSRDRTKPKSEETLLSKGGMKKNWDRGPVPTRSISKKKKGKEIFRRKAPMKNKSQGGESINGGRSINRQFSFEIHYRGKRGGATAKRARSHRKGGSG